LCKNLPKTLLTCPDTKYIVLGEERQKAKNSCLRTTARAYKATPVRSLQAKVGFSHLPLNMDSRQARFCLQPAELGIDMVVREGIVKVN
jgi:hypothetical protein